MSTTVTTAPAAAEGAADVASGASASTSTSTSANIYDPFLSSRGFSYEPSSSVRAHYPLSTKSIVPDHIEKPNYAKENFMQSRNIVVTSKDTQQGVRQAATLARQVLEMAAAAIRPGITTDEIDKIVFEEAIKRDCYPSPLGYHGFPKSVCTSVNEIVCHGIPDQRPLQDGDLINLDVTLFHKGYHGDLNATYMVGPTGAADESSLHLIKAARECLDAAIAICGPGVPFAEIGQVIEPMAKEKGCSVVKAYTGHGIGKVFHGAPVVYHHITNKSYGIMQPGHIFTIEPMLNAGLNNHKTKDWPDDWTVTTKDGSRSAAAEETLLITDQGVEVLTAQGGPRSLDTRENRRAWNERKRA
ncbi:methionine aminopeptidase [Ceraceosorus guamensis]|uniref:Methionine aminopeptidase n=1 Tax=Ceraceosorus guamensis TaxID=1522189 RepID=A0A316VQL8_9BASI|nr:methionine aminopeptidase [Ceraceosorus guamensis]PWN38723.1 methionine aminopeptidase [Ceraceosorus guamensis]